MIQRILRNKKKKRIKFFAQQNISRRPLPIILFTYKKRDYNCKGIADVRKIKNILE